MTWLAYKANPKLTRAAYSEWKTNACVGHEAKKVYKPAFLALPTPATMGRSGITVRCSAVLADPSPYNVVQVRVLLVPLHS